jgi:LmbE family N-acetylglucosaminyl deacetylase
MTNTTKSTLNEIVCPAEWGQVCIISPHLDDAVLSCGALLSQCTSALIVTVMSGDSPDLEVLTEWDRMCGFENAALAMSARRNEDHLAAEILSCDVLHLPFPDGQYAPDVSTDDLVEGLTNALHDRQIDTLLLPLGIFHSDHMRVAAAWQHPAFSALLRNPYMRVICYEDVPYRHIGDALQQALAKLTSLGWHACSLRSARDRSDARAIDGSPSARALTLKRSALLAYASQLKALPADWIEDAWTPERYWQLYWDPTPPPKNLPKTPAISRSEKTEPYSAD